MNVFQWLLKSFRTSDIPLNDLNVFSMPLNEQGDYEIQQYRRRLVPTGMELELSASARARKFARCAAG